MILLQTVFKNTDYRMDGYNAVDPLMHELLKSQRKEYNHSQSFPAKMLHIERVTNLSITAEDHGKYSRKKDIHTV